MPRYFNDPTLPTPTFPGSHLVMDKHYAHLSGLTVADIQDGDSVIGDAAEETRWILRRVDHLLEQAGCQLADAVRVQIHVTDLALQADVDSVYAEWFDQASFPARTCTVSPQLHGGASVEITVTARRPEGATPDDPN